MTVPAIVIVGRTQDPHAGVVHFHDGIDPLGWPKFQHPHFFGNRDGIAVHRNYPKLMARGGDPAVHGRAGVEDAQQNMLPSLSRGSVRHARGLGR